MQQNPSIHPHRGAGEDFQSALNSLFLEPQEGTDSMLFFKLHLEAAAGHDSRLAAPAGFMVQIDTVHVEAWADLLDLAFVAREFFVEHL
jgi:hypothetical protein